MVTLVGIKLVFISMQIIFSTSEINSEIEQMEISLLQQKCHTLLHHVIHYIRNTHALLT